MVQHFIFFFKDRYHYVVALGGLELHYAAQAQKSTSASRVPRLKVCATIPSLVTFCFLVFYVQYTFSSFKNSQ